MSAKDQIKQIVDYFKREPQLKDKTDGMAEGLLLGANLADEANERSKDATETTLAVQEKYKEQILAQDLNPNKDPELVDIRDGNTTAGERIRKFEQETNRQLAQTEEKTKWVDVAVNFGAIGDYDEVAKTGTDNTDSFVSAIAYAKSKGVKLVIPEGNFKFTGELVFPDKVEFRGKVSVGKVIFSGKDLVIDNLNCDEVLFSGVWRATTTVKHTKKTVIDGKNWDWGSYWNTFIGGLHEEVVLDITEGPVNQNNFNGGRAGSVLITGTTEKYANTEAHNNWFRSIDISTGGVLQNDDRMQTNYLENVYCENGGEIKGNWQILGVNGDKTPALGLRSHILFANDAIPANSQDFISAAAPNLIEGGEWDSLNTKGYPKAITMINAQATVVSYPGAPDGSGKALHVQSEAAWSGIQMKIENLPKQGGMVFFVLGDIKAAEFIDNEGTVFSNPITKVPLGGGWHIWRVAFPKTITGLKYFRMYLNTNSATSSFLFISGIKATQYKAVLLPQYDYSSYCRGAVDSVPTEGIWRKGEFVMNTNDTLNPSINGWRCVGSAPLIFKPF